MSERFWVSAEQCSIDDFRAIVEVPTNGSDYPLAARVELGVVVYDGDRIRREIATGNERAVLEELARVLDTGPGVVAFDGAVDTDAIDRASAEFEAIIDGERGDIGDVGDHFAQAGSNDRVWNALEKLALRSPDVFVDYYVNDIIALVSRSWLGPGYQMTSQVNVVNPGGQAQQPHRDYHLGFMEDAEAEQYPAHIHRLSPFMTLQGAVAHCDMPIETGPTTYLPHSQKYEAGYVAWRRDDFKEYFAEHHTQLPLMKGSAVFFNPAVFHGAGTNRTADVRRMANLLQVSTMFGRSMEDVDRRSMVEQVYPVLIDRLTSGAPRSAIDNVVAACAEGYAFPGDLDVDQPVSGLAPPSQADLVGQALDERCSPTELQSLLRPKKAVS